MRKFLSFAALALSSGAAVIAAGGAAQASSGAHDWCAAPTSALKVDAACLTNHSTIHVGPDTTDLDSNWCLGAFAAFGDHWSAPALSCEDHMGPGHHHVPGPPPMTEPSCHEVCTPHTPPPPPPPMTPPHPCPPPPMTPPPPPPPPVTQPCPPPPPPVNCPPGDDDHHWAATAAHDAPAAGEGTAGAAGTAGLPIVGNALGGLL